ncbi:MAG: nitrous oxide-stimulated promoter family protein [Candidatus Margulisiibacteriota bacterium]
MGRIRSKNNGELNKVAKLIGIYCKNKHNSDSMCGECGDLLAYATKRLALCPYEVKPKCKECKTHCYDLAHRDRIRQVMRFSGMHMVKHGRIDLMFGYFIKDRILSFYRRHRQ